MAIGERRGNRLLRRTDGRTRTNRGDDEEGWERKKKKKKRRGEEWKGATEGDEELKTKPKTSPA